MKIREMHSTGLSARLYMTHDQGYKFDKTVNCSKFTQEQQAIWLGSLSWLGSNTMVAGETASGIVLERLSDAIVAATTPQVVNGQAIQVATDWRDEIKVSVSVNSSMGTKDRPGTCENLPSELRYGMLALWNYLESLTPEQLDALN
jgi:hypothetical protein